MNAGHSAQCNTMRLSLWLAAASAVPVVRVVRTCSIVRCCECSVRTHNTWFLAMEAVLVELIRTQNTTCLLLIALPQLECSQHCMTLLTAVTQALIPALEAVLRHIAATMLSSSSTASSSSDAKSAFSNKQHAADIIKCLEYLRDRVGVPRDMSYPAAYAYEQCACARRRTSLGQQRLVTTDVCVNKHCKHYGSSFVIAATALLNVCLIFYANTLRSAVILLHCAHCHTTARQLRAHLNWAIDNLK
eukprot:15033-Heterococcus_DN1.PRE.5